MLQNCYKTKAQIAYEYVLKKIHEASVKPGEKLVIEKITEELGISRIPVREAFKKLESEGILNVVPNKSAVLRSISAKDIHDIYDIRRVIESHAATVALSNLSQKDFKFLEDNFQRMKKSVMDKKINEYIRLNRDFHFFIYGKTGNEWMVKFIESLWYFGRWVNIITFFSRDIQRGYLRDHEKILGALKRKEKDALRRAFSEHIGQAQKNVFNYLSAKET